MLNYRKFYVTSSDEGETIKDPTNGGGTPIAASWSTELGQVVVIWSAPGSYTEMEGFEDDSHD